MKSTQHGRSAELPESGKHLTLERRAYGRVPLDVPVLIDCYASHHAARCRNVSVGGLVVSTTVALEPGTRGEVYFELPNGVPVETSFEVARLGAGELALRFIELDREMLLALRSYCRLNRMVSKVG